MRDCEDDGVRVEGAEAGPVNVVEVWNELLDEVEELRLIVVDAELNGDSEEPEEV